MTEIKDVRVMELEECVIASGLAMRTEPYNYEEEMQPDKWEKHIKRCCKLVQSSKNTDVHCHDNFLTGIRVSFDIKYPQYLSPEMQRYHFFDIVTSMSKMHKLLKMNITKCCNKYVTKAIIDNLNKYIAEYNETVELLANCADKESQNIIYEAWMKVISNCPLGLELWMRASTNYKQLQTIYYQRRHHKLVEDWSAICEMIEQLPYFKEFILGIDNKESYESVTERRRKMGINRN